jgi:hypothetical protein
MRSILYGLFGAVILCAVAARPVKADIEWTASGSDSNGALDAQAVFTISNGQIEVTVTNLLNPATIVSIGQSVSDVIFTISNAPGTDAGNTAVGQQVNVAANGAVTDVSGAPNRWISSSTGGFGISGDTINLEAIGHGQPNELILPSDDGGYYPDASSSITVHEPDTDGPATFTLDLAGVTSSTTISDVQFSFGTGPDTTIDGTLSISAPEPSAAIILLTMLLAIALLARKRMA